MTVNCYWVRAKVISFGFYLGGGMCITKDINKPMGINGVFGSGC